MPALTLLEHIVCRARSLLGSSPVLEGHRNDLLGRSKGSCIAIDLAPTGAYDSLGNAFRETTASQ